jgi:sugar phosphate permease
MRTKASALINSGKIIGTSMQSLSIYLIEGIGWRGSYISAGLFGVFIGIIALVVIREPKRGVFDPAKFKKEEEQNKLPESLVIDKEKSDEESKDPGSDQPAKESALTKTLGGFAAVFKDKCCFWVMLGNCCRYWEAYTVTNFSLQYFNLFGKPNLYAGLNALALLIGGVGGNFATGYICDKYELVNFRTKSIVMTM